VSPVHFNSVWRYALFESIYICVVVSERFSDAYCVSKGTCNGFMYVKLRQVVHLSSRFNILNKNTQAFGFWQVFQSRRPGSTFIRRWHGYFCKNNCGYSLQKLQLVCQ